MSKNKIKKLKFISMLEASKLCSYSQEYLSLLARKKQIFSKKIGRNWCTTAEAVAEYVEKRAQENLRFVQPIIDSTPKPPLSGRAKTLLSFVVLGVFLFFLISTVSITKPSSSSSALISFSLPSYIKNIPSVLKQITSNLLANKDQALKELANKILELEKRTVSLPLTRDKTIVIQPSTERVIERPAKSPVPTRDRFNEEAISALGRQVVSQGLRIDSLASLASLEQRFDDLRLTVSSRLSNVPTILIPPSTSTGAGITILNPANLESENVTISRLLTVQGSAVIDGDFSVDSNTLYVDSFNNRVGINTSNLETAFEVNGTASISGGLTLGGNLTITDNLTNSSSAFLTNASVSSAFEVGNNKFYVSGVNNYSGFNTNFPTTILEVQGTASASYLLTGNTLQVGGFSSAAYSRFGTDTTGYSHFISTTNDLLISGDLEVNGSANFDTFLRVGTNQIPALYANVSTGNVGIGTTSPLTKFEVQGTASASNLFTVGSLQIGAGASTATVSYNRFGTAATTHSNYISANNDLLVSGDLEVRSSLSIGGTASISGSLFVFGNIGIGTTSVPNQLTVVGSGSFTGQLKATRNPTQAHTGTWPSFSNTNDSTFLVNPSSPVADGNVIAYVNGSDPKFIVDTEGDVFVAGNLTLSGTTTQATTNVSGDLIVEGNSRLGDSSTDLIKLTGTIRPFSLTSFPLLVRASTSQTQDVFRFQDPDANTLLTLDQGTGLLTASSGFNFALGGSTATASYSRLGTATTGHSLANKDDLLVTGLTEFDDNAFFDAKASISSNLQISGRFIADTAASHSFTGDLTISKEFVSSGAASNSFAGSLLISKGLNAQAIVGTSLTINGNISNTGNTILGDASGDTVTSNADAWTFANDTNLILSGGVNGLSFDTSTLSIDSTNDRVGINTTTPQTKFEVQGTASASYLLTGNTLQVGGYSSAAYSRFGTDTTSYSAELDTINDLLISGALEINGNTFLDGKASISGNFQTAGRFIFGDNGDTGEINTSDWDISTGGNLTGIGTIAADGAYTQTGAGANTFSGSTTFSSTGLALLVSTGRAEFQGTASASYGLFGTLQVGGFSSASYNRFGTGTTSQAHYITTSNDLLISGDLEVDGSVSFAGPASISNTLYVSTLGKTGNVGIGTSAPAAPLDINAGATSSGLILYGTNTSGLIFDMNSNATGGRHYFLQTTADVAGPGGGKFLIRDADDSSATRFAIDSTGNVGIGTTAPTSKLEVLGGRLEVG
ncbi:MAG TPA: hypothetical protein VI978_01350, partial [Candidatus Paceibacterota bacterium]